MFPQGTLCVPVPNDAPFIVPATYTEAAVTPLQEACLSAMEALIKVKKVTVHSDNILYAFIFLNPNPLANKTI